MRNMVYMICLIISIGVLLTGCKGEKGDTGPAGPSGTSIFLGGDAQAITLSSSVTMARQISITVSGPGTIIFSASGYFYYNYYSSNYIGRASISLNTYAMDYNYLCVVEGDGSYSFNPYIVTRGMTVSAAGTYTAYLLLDETRGTGIQAVKNSVTATFTPQ